MSADDTEAVREDVGQALTQALGKHGYMTTRWVVGAEVIGQDGERSLWGLCPVGQKAWDTLGILHHLDQLEAAERTAEAVEGR